ncbi:MAG: hypothetical protein N2235_16350 [Fischerella sp.]|nr:hypothetical protein [Fischerella sp.]
MSEQLFFEDIKVGDEIPAIKKEVTNVNIMMYIATVWLLDRIHFDYVFATKRRGLPDVVAPGNMAGDYYCQLLTDWAGDKGKLKKLKLQYRNFMVPGNILECGGKVIKKYTEDGKGLVELELWLKNEKGINCVPGSAVVELPIKE